MDPAELAAETRFTRILYRSLTKTKVKVVNKNITTAKVTA